MKKCISVMVVAATVAMAGAAQARDYIRIVGSSTVFPFSSAVAERFGNDTRFKTPVVESTGSGGGMKLFCAGVGEAYPDITNASRRMKRSEWDLCRKNGVTDITEITIGYDGIVIANSIDAPKLDLTLAQVFKAFAAKVPVGGVLVDNPYQKWSDIDAGLPDVKIEAFGPPPTSGTRDAFVEIAMQKGAESFPELKALKSAVGAEAITAAADAIKLPKQCLDAALAKGKGETGFECVAHKLRENDGAWNDAGEDDNAIVTTLEQNPSAVGVFGFSYVDQNASRIQGSDIDGVEPTFESIADHSYPLARDLWFYIKDQHVDSVAPGIREYAEAFTSEDAFGPDGYLVDKGLIYLPDDERAAMRAKAAALTKMTGNEPLE